MEEKMIKVEEERAMVYIPRDAIEIEISAKLYLGGDSFKDVKKTMNMHEIREAIRKAEEGYIDEDDVFELTDKGRAYLDGLIEE